MTLLNTYLFDFFQLTL